MQNSYRYLLNIEYKNNLVVFLSIFIISVCIILACVLSTYSSFAFMALYKDGALIIDVPINNSDAVNKGNFIKVQNSKYTYEVLETGNIKTVNYINYQEYKIKINESFKENQVIEVTFYYKKQKIIKKILDIIF